MSDNEGLVCSPNTRCLRISRMAGSSFKAGDANGVSDFPLNIPRVDSLVNYIESDGEG